MITIKQSDTHIFKNASALIQSAIDRAASCGEKLTIERGVYICGTLFLRSNLKMRLEPGAVILGSGRFGDYSADVNLFVDAVDHERGRSLIYADGVENVTISGGGIIDGRGALFSESHPHHGERPFLVRIMNSKKISFENITLKNPAAWTLHLFNCEDVSVKSLFVLSRANANNDGIDIDCCRRCVIDSCTIDSGDDAVCIKSTDDIPCSGITAKNCVITTNWAGFKIGTESVGDISDIVFEDSFIYDCMGCAIKICPTDGASVKNVTIKNIRLKNATGPVFIANGERMRRYQNGRQKAAPSSIENVLIKNLRGSCSDAAGTVYKGAPWGNAKAAVCISGTEKTHIKNVRLESLELLMPGGTENYVPHTIPQLGGEYPEFHLFGTLPAWGVYARFIDGFSAEDMRLSPAAHDCRDVIVTENVTKL